MTGKTNVLGGPLALCNCSPTTGFFRDGYCRTDDSDAGLHVVCALVTDELITFTKAQGNDLSTPRPEFDFPGLAPGDRWCLCAQRWKEAWQAGCAPPVVLASCDVSTLDIIPIDVLKQHAVDSH